MVYDHLCRSYNVAPKKGYMKEFPKPKKYELGSAIFAICELENNNLFIYEDIIKA